MPRLRGVFFEILPPRDIVRAYILKGGPGVGKSTLMRRAGDMWERAGYDVDYYYCSGDPDSVDAVTAGGYMLLDGTSPHVVDPALPGAADGIINLGQCLDENAMAAQRDAARRLTRDTSRAYARAYRYLAGAAQALADSAEVYKAAVDEGALCNLRLSLMERLRGEPGRAQRLYAQAITNKGVVHHAQGVLREETVCLELPFGFDQDSIIRPLAAACRARGMGCRRFMDPLDASRGAHIATSGFAVVTLIQPGCERLTLPFDEALLRRERSALDFNRAAYRLMLSQAVESLCDAKAAHDALERLYADAMDYQRLDEIAGETLEKMRLPAL